VGGGDIVPPHLPVAPPMSTIKYNLGYIIYNSIIKKPMPPAYAYFTSWPSHENFETKRAEPG